MTSTDLAVIDTTPTSQILGLVDEAYLLAQRVATTAIVPAAYKNKPDELLASILTGAELGLPPMTSMAKIHNIQGRAGLAAELMRALPLSHGHSIWIEEASPIKVTVAGHRARDADHVSRISWTADMVKRAGLDGKENHRKFPQAMLLARATGDLCRTIFADCLAGISYTVEELEDGIVDEPWAGQVEDRPDGAAPPPPPADNARKLPAKRPRKATKKARPAGPPATSGPVDDFDEIDRLATGDETGERPLEERRSDAIRIRTEEVLGQVSRDERLAFWSASVGHPVDSGLSLSSEDADRIAVDLEGIEGGHQTWDGRRIVIEADVVDDTYEVGDAEHDINAEAGGSDPELSWSAEDWKTFRTEHGLSHAGFIKIAAAVAGELELGAVPGTIPAIVEQGDDFKRLLVLRVEEREN